MSFFMSKKKEKNTEKPDNWQDVIIDNKDIQTILSNQEKAHPNRLKTLQSLETIIENQQVILGYIDTMTKKMNDMEYRLRQQSGQTGIFSSYLKPSIFPYLDKDSTAEDIRKENLLKRKSPTHASNKHLEN